MAHHGWIHVLDKRSLTPSALKSPFGRLFEAADHSYDSLAISMLAGADGPIEQAGSKKKEDVCEGEPYKSGNPAGYTFLGQFIDHDLTEFRVINEDLRITPSNPTIGQRQRVLEDGNANCTNGRIGALDLDCVYGLLGAAQPDLYDEKGLFLLYTFDSKGNTIARPADDPGDGKDIRRDKRYNHGRLIADPRNDENKLVVQIHMLFMKLHNKIHEASGELDPTTGPGSERFEQTKRTVQNIFRRIVLFDYLPRIVQQPHLQAVLDKLCSSSDQPGNVTYYQQMCRRAEDAFNGVTGLPPDAAPLPDRQSTPAFRAMPVEFAHAVFRLGHTQLLNGYALTGATDDKGNPVRVPLFASNGDLRGNAPLAPEFQIHWPLFFDIGGETANHGNPIDAHLPAAVFRLPPPTIGEPPQSLAERNIRRGIDFGLPSGQEVASVLSSRYGAIPPTPADKLFPKKDFEDRFAEVLERDQSIAWATPLWYYVLREAGEYTEGPQLGAVGGLIVAETILGCLATEPLDHFDLCKEVTEGPWGEDPEKIAKGKVNAPSDILTMPQLISYI